jgi:hypothetical protein
MNKLLHGALDTLPQRTTSTMDLRNDLAHHC